MAVVVAIDAGTTGVRSMAVDESGREVGYSYREFRQHFPQPGWVEHDANEIWSAVRETLAELCEQLGELSQAVAAIGITNQRETTVAWSRSTGEPAHRAIVWQDTRTSQRCASLTSQGHLDEIAERTGLLIDPYFSATKMEWLIKNADLPPSRDLALGTIDAWLIFKLSGAAKVFRTDYTNASRTLLYSIGRGAEGSGDTASSARGWDSSLCDLFSVPVEALPEVVPSIGELASTADTTAVGAGIPIAGVAGDQQSSLFGQTCFQPGETKSTYGTGSFILMNTGASRPSPLEGLLTTLAVSADEAAADAPIYAYEGSVFATGAAIQWLRDELGIISESSQIGPLAQSVPTSEGVCFVPAFAGLGSPWWDPDARGLLIGMTRGSTRAHIARAVLESIAFQVRSVIDLMSQGSGHQISALSVDGGAAASDLLMRIQADQLGVTVSRPQNTQTTAMGAAMMAGLAVGFWSSSDELRRAWQLDRSFEPDGSARASADADYERWLRAVERSLGWAD